MKHGHMHLDSVQTPQSPIRNGNACSLPTQPASPLALSAPTVTEDPVLRDLQGVYDELAAHRKHVTKMMSNVKRCFTKVEKRLEKSAPASKKSGNAHGGLMKPFPVSDSLCSFMCVPKGTLLARAAVTRYLHQHIQTNELHDKQNRQYIIPDGPLRNLFNLSGNSRIHLFSMQEKVNAHFKYPVSGSHAKSDSSRSSGTHTLTSEVEGGRGRADGQRPAEAPVEAPSGCSDRGHP